MAADQSELDALREAVRAVFDSASLLPAARAFADNGNGFDQELWRTIADELGISAIGIPEEYEGAGGGLNELSVVLEESGRALYSGPFLASTVLAGQALSRLGTEDAKREWLPQIADGSLVATLALRQSTDGEQVIARGGRLHGTREFVFGGSEAELILVDAVDESGQLALYAVAADNSGVERSALNTLDFGVRLARINFADADSVRVSATDTPEAMQSELTELGLIGVAWEQVGAARRCLEMTVEYAGTRHQFGRPLAGFQVIKHRAADMFYRVEAAGASVRDATERFDEPVSAERTRALHAAKARASEALVQCAEDNVQIHGGIGMTWEADPHLYLRRAWSSRAMFGTPDEHYAAIAKSLGDELNAA